MSADLRQLLAEIREACVDLDGDHDGVHVRAFDRLVPRDDHAPVFPAVTASTPIGQPVDCAKCGGRIHVVCGDASPMFGVAGVVDRAPAAARSPEEADDPKRCRTCHGEIVRVPGRRGRPPVQCEECRGKAAAA